jgi:putative redox protein
MKIHLHRINDALAFEASNSEGQKTTVDASEKVGGAGLGLRPMELVASALASCASIDVLLILKKKRIALQNYEIEVDAVRKDGVPAPFESIHLQFRIDPADPLETVEKAVALSIEKYCSVAAVLSPACTITYEVTNDLSKAL